MLDQITLLNSCIATDYRFCIDADFSRDDLVDVLGIKRSVPNCDPLYYREETRKQIENKYGHYTESKKEALLIKMIDLYEREISEQTTRHILLVRKILKSLGLTLRVTENSLFRVMPIESWETAKEKLIEAVENSDYVKRRHIEDRGANAMEFVLDNLNWKTR